MCAAAHAQCMPRSVREMIVLCSMQSGGCTQAPPGVLIFRRFPSCSMWGSRHRCMPPQPLLAQCPPHRPSILRSEGAVCECCKTDLPCRQMADAIAVARGKIISPKSMHWGSLCACWWVGALTSPNRTFMHLCCWIHCAADARGVNQPTLCQVTIRH
jgi:hypothetical protein